MNTSTKGSDIEGDFGNSVKQLGHTSYTHKRNYMAIIQSDNISVCHKLWSMTSMHALWTNIELFFLQEQ
jgi:hypothetical protein